MIKNFSDHSTNALAIDSADPRPGAGSRADLVLATMMVLLGLSLLFYLSHAFVAKL